MPSLSLPFVLFIDDFGVHRNMYGALKAFYITPACLDYTDRRKPSNGFALTLGPHGASFDEIVSNLESGMQALCHGVTLDIRGEKLVKAFPILLTGDMPQAADNSGFLRHNATIGCRSCYCPKYENGNLDFDVEGHGRYHFDSVLLRQEGASLPTAKQRTTFVKSLGLRPEPPAVAKIAPSLDLILGRGYDTPHSEWRGIGRVLYTLLFQHILTKACGIAFITAFQAFPFPYDWPRIQSPIHLFSWSLSETGRAMIVLSLLLRSCGRITWYKMSYVQAISYYTGKHDLIRTCDTPISAIITLFRVIAETLTATGSWRQISHSVTKVHQLLIRSRRSYMLLINCAEASKSKASRHMRSQDDDDEDEAEGEAFPSLSDVEKEELRFQADENLDTDDMEDRDADIETRLSADPTANTAVMSDLDLGSSNASDAGLEPKRRKMNKWEKLRCLPNVHVALHLSQNVFEYAHVMNANVLCGELLHK